MLRHYILGWKSIPGPNALAYYENSYLMAVKSFISLAPEVVFIAPVSIELTNGPKNIVCFYCQPFLD